MDSEYKNYYEYDIRAVNPKITKKEYFEEHIKRKKELRKYYKLVKKNKNNIYSGRENSIYNAVDVYKITSQICAMKLIDEDFFKREINFATLVVNNR